MKNQISFNLLARVNAALEPRAVSKEAAVSHMLAAGWCVFSLVDGGGAVLRKFVRTTIDEATGIYPAPSQAQKREVENLLSETAENWPRTAPLGSCRRAARDKGGRLGNVVLRVGRAIAEQAVAVPDSDANIEIIWNYQEPRIKAWALVNARTVNAVELAAEVWRLVCGDTDSPDYGNDVAAAVGRFRNAAAQALLHDWEIIPAPAQVEDSPVTA